MTYLVPIETTPVGRPVQMVSVTRLCPVGRLVPDASLSPVEMAPVISLLLRWLLSCLSLSPVEMAPVMPLTLSCRDGSCHASHPLLLIWLLSCLSPSPVEMAPVMPLTPVSYTHLRAHETG